MRVLYDSGTLVRVARILASSSAEPQDTASFDGTWENALGIVIAFVVRFKAKIAIKQCPLAVLAPPA
jgi:hypothetical protein